MSADPEQAAGTPDPGNSPDPSAVTQDPAPSVDWEQRAKDHQAAFTRSQQELAAMRRILSGEDQDGLRSTLQQLGYEFEDDDPAVPEPGNSDDPVFAKLTELEQWKDQQEQERQQQHVQAEWDGWRQHVRDRAKQAGVDLADHELNGLMVKSVAQDGLPVAPDDANDVVDGYLTERQQWLEQVAGGTRRPRAPHVPTGGGSPDGPNKPVHEMTSAERQQYLIERAHAEAG